MTVTPQQLAADYELFRSVLDQYGAGNTLINGPALAYISSYLAEFADAVVAVKDVVNDVSWHHCEYY